MILPRNQNIWKLMQHKQLLKYRRGNRDLIQSQNLFPIGQGRGKKPTFPGLSPDLYMPNILLYPREDPLQPGNPTTHIDGKSFQALWKCSFSPLRIYQFSLIFRYILSCVSCFKAQRGEKKFFSNQFQISIPVIF